MQDSLLRGFKKHRPIVLIIHVYLYILIYKLLYEVFVSNIRNVFSNKIEENIKHLFWRNISLIKNLWLTFSYNA